METKKVLFVLNDQAVSQLDQTAAELVDLIGRDNGTQRPNRSALLRALIATADTRKLRRFLKQQTAA